MTAISINLTTKIVHFNVHFWHKANRLRRREVYYERGAEVGTFSPTKVTVEIVAFHFFVPLDIKAKPAF